MKKYAIVWETGLKDIPRSTRRISASSAKQAHMRFKKMFPKRKIADIHLE